MCIELEDLCGEGADAADEILSKTLGVRIEKALDPMNTRDFETIVRKLARAMRKHAWSFETLAASSLFLALDIDWTDMPEEARNRVLDKVKAGVGLQMAATVLPGINMLLSSSAERIVPATKKGAIETYNLHIGVSLNSMDERIEKYCRVSQGHFVTNRYGVRSEAWSAQARDTVASGLAQGLGRDDISQALHASLGGLMERGQSYWDVIASTFANRARTLSLLASFDEAGIGEYVWQSVLDEVTCFAAGTKVLVGGGKTRLIERMHAGDQVISCKGRLRKVLSVKVTPRKQWIRVTFSSGRAFLVAPHHMILSECGWIRADKLVVGGNVVQHEGSDLQNLWEDVRKDEMGVVRDHDDSGVGAGRDDESELYPERVNRVWPVPSTKHLERCGLLEVVSIEPVTTTLLPSYDLEVEDDAGYIVEGVVVHNSDACRFLDGRRFPVKGAMERFQEAEDLSDPSDIKYVQPFLSVGNMDDEGGKGLYYKDADGVRTYVARIEESGVGRKDDRGKYSAASEDDALAAAGIHAPPIHGSCRSSVVAG